MSLSTTRLGTITGVNPYQVQLLGESNPLNVPPVVLTTVNTGDTVWCEFVGQQLVVYGRIQDGSVPQLGSTEDLNNFVYTGVWNQALNANTSTAHNYPVVPVMGVPQAGLLEVWRAETNGNMIHQRYTDYLARGVFFRTYYYGQNVWSAWAQAGGVPTWTNMTLTNGWSNYANGYQVARYTKIGGIVYLEGLVASGTLGAGGYFTLPVGFRPSAHIQYTGNSSGGVADLRIFGTGVCSVYALYSGTTASVSISTSFPADQ